MSYITVRQQLLKIAAQPLPTSQSSTPHLDAKVAAARGIGATRISDFDKLQTTGGHQPFSGTYDDSSWTDAAPSWYDKFKSWVVTKYYSATQILANI